MTQVNRSVSLKEIPDKMTEGLTLALLNQVIGCKPN